MHSHPLMCWQNFSAFFIVGQSHPWILGSWGQFWGHCHFHAITAINLKPGILLPHRPLRNPICFGDMTLIFKVTEVTKVKFDFQSITAKVFELLTWNLVKTLVSGQARCLFFGGHWDPFLGSLGSVFGVTGVNFGITVVNFWGRWSITPNILELPTWNLVQTLDKGQARHLFILELLGSISGSLIAKR